MVVWGTATRGAAARVAGEARAGEGMRETPGACLRQGGLCSRGLQQRPVPPAAPLALTQLRVTSSAPLEVVAAGWLRAAAAAAAAAAVVMAAG